MESVKLSNAMKADEASTIKEKSYLGGMFSEEAQLVGIISQARGKQPHIWEI